jgi:predicted nucleic-acid-binding protein
VLLQYVKTASHNIYIEQREVVQATGHICRRSKASFVGVLIEQVAKSAGCGQTMGFDKTAVRNAGMVAV